MYHLLLQDTSGINLVSPKAQLSPKGICKVLSKSYRQFLRNHQNLDLIVQRTFESCWQWRKELWTLLDYTDVIEHHLKDSQNASETPGKTFWCGTRFRQYRSHKFLVWWLLVNFANILARQQFFTTAYSRQLVGVDRFGKPVKIWKTQTFRSTFVSSASMQKFFSFNSMSSFNLISALMFE